MLTRNNGRAKDSLRPVTLERNFTNQADGSVLVSFGDTKVICTASFVDRVPPWLKGQGKGWVTAEYAMIPGATAPRSNRDAFKKGRSQEISRLIGRSLRAVVDLEAMGECQVTLDCDVIQADGGTRTAAITGAFVALYDAFAQSRDKGFLQEIPITAPCAAISVGLVDGEVLLDLDYSEDVRADVDMNVVMNGMNEFIEVQGCGEGSTFPKPVLLELLATAEKGISELIQLQQETLSVD